MSFSPFKPFSVFDVMDGVGGGYTPPLDDYTTNLVSAYSTRLLLTSYSGDCMRVRRSSDNAEADIGFVNGELDTPSLLAHTGAGDGFVKTWYDQSGNGNDATQTTTARQPRIVAGEVIDSLAGAPTLHRISEDQGGLLVTHGTPIAQPFTRFASLRITSPGADNFSFMFRSTAPDIILGGANSAGSKWAIYAGTYLYGEIVAADDNISTALYSGANSIIRINGTEDVTGNTGTSSMANETICGSQFSSAENPSSADLSEYLLYSADITSQFTAIEEVLAGYNGTSLP